MRGRGKGGGGKGGGEGGGGGAGCGKKGIIPAPPVLEDERFKEGLVGGREGNGGFVGGAWIPRLA